MDIIIDQIATKITEECYLQKHEVKKLLNFFEKGAYSYDCYEYYENSKYSLTLQANDINNKKTIAILMKVNNQDIPVEKSQIDKLFNLQFTSLKKLYLDIYTVDIFDFDQYLSLTKIFTYYELNDSTYHLVNMLDVKKSKFQIDFQDSNIIGQNISKCTNLSALKLDLDQTQIKCICLQKILSDASKCQQITQISLNLFKSQATLHTNKVIGAELVKFQNLVNLHLDIQNNYFCENDVTWLARGLQKTVKLESLSIYLYNNKIGDQGAEDFGQALEKLINLKNLILVFRENKITKKGLGGLSKGLQNCTNLVNLQLFLQQNILREGMQFLGEALQNLLKLQYLKLSLRQTVINATMVLFVFQGISKLQNLLNLELDLGKNYIEGSIAIKQLGLHLSKCSNLRIYTLNIGDIRIDLVDVQRILKQTTKGKRLANFYVLD